MPRSCYNLRRDIFRCTTERISLVGSFTDPLFGEAEVGNFQVTLVIQQDILWLQIPFIIMLRIIFLPIDDPLFVQSFKCTYQLGRVEPSPHFGEPLFLPQMEEQLPPIQKVHNEIELLSCLESVVQIDDEWALYLFHDLTFNYHIIINGIFTLSLEVEIS